MAKNYFFESTSDADLAKDLLAGAAELYIQKQEFSGTAVLTLVGGGNDTLILADGGAAADDDYDSSAADNLLIVDDNGVLARGKVIDTMSESAGTQLTFEASNMVLVSDGVTAPTFTDGATYTVRVLSGSNTNQFGVFFGYTDDSVEFDATTETEPLEIVNIEGQTEEVAEKVNKRAVTMKGATYNVPNSDVLSKIMNMESYGLNTATHKEFHGGFSPNIQSFYQMTALTKDWQGNNVAVQIFKAQLKNDGAIALGGASWKSIKFSLNGKKDELRDSVKVNAFSILIWA